MGDLPLARQLTEGAAHAWEMGLPQQLKPSVLQVRGGSQLPIQMVGVFLFFVFVFLRQGFHLPSVS